MATKVIGLVGPIGAGKSTVAGLFGRMGAEVLDADRIAHAALDAPALRARIVRLWGPEVLTDLRIDRRKLGDRVFRDPKGLKRLEAIVHPWVGRQIDRRLSRNGKGRGTHWVALDIPLLVESGWDKKCDVLVYVHAPAAECRRRVERRGWTEAERRRRQALQMKLPLKRKLCAFEIDNDTSLRRVGQQVRRVWRTLNTERQGGE